VSHRIAPCLFLALALLFSSACNSTNRIGQESLAEADDAIADDGLGQDSVEGRGAAEGPGLSKSAGGRTASAAGSAGSATDRASGGGDASSGGGSNASGIGSTDKTPLKLGFIVIKGGDALVLNALGTPVSFGDGRKQVNALVKDLNARGGINGRPVEPIFYEWNVADANDSPARGCVALAEDHHVFAILTVVNVNQEMAACAAKHKTILINASFGAGDAYMYQQFGDWFFSPSLLLQNQQKRVLLQSMRSSGRLGRGVKVGIAILGDDQQFQRVADTTIIPMLKAYKVPYVAATMENDADVSGAVLRFRSEGVNLVVFSSASAIPPLLFMRQADSQGWSPNYAMTDSDDTNTLGQYAPRSQTSKIRGVGTQPISNVDVNQHPHSAQEKRCLAIMRKGGENDTHRRSSLTAEPYCEALWDFEAVARRVTGTLTSQAFRTAFSSVGRTYKPVMTFTTDFANGRHDNASSYRTLAWKTSCSCVGYTGPLQAIPPL
jgi:ABC-type branched-subunit amino acid transport system substrate-binding protein